MRELRSLSGTACCAAAPPHREIIELAVNMCQDCAPCPGRTRSVEAASATAAASLGRLRWRDHATMLLAASIAATTAGRAMGASAGALDRQPPWVAIGPSPRFGVDVQPCGQSLCLGDEPYPVKGVNYFPFGPWDAWKLDNDFAAMRRGGVNTVLVMSGAFSDNLTLFLDRLQAHGLRTIMYGPTYSRHPAVLGYDMCWECHLGHAQQRSSMLPAWQDWLADRFIGNVASCFHGEAPSLPTDAELCDRNASAAVAVFHRFVLDYENARFRDRAHEIRQSDPHHLLTFRNGWGLGWFGKCAVPGTDLRTAARVVDAISPEGYFFGPNGITDTLAKEQAWGGFDFAYGDVGKPILLFEYGTDSGCKAWTAAGRPCPPPHVRLQFQREKVVNVTEVWRKHFGILSLDFHRWQGKHPASGRQRRLRVGVQLPG